MFRNALKEPKAEREFFCNSVFLEAGLAKWGILKRIRTLEWLSEGNKQKIARSATVCGQLCMSPTIRRYRTHQKSLCQHPCYCCQVPKFLQNLSFLLPRIFAPPYTITIPSSAWRTFASSLIDVSSFVLRCFRFPEPVHGLNVVYVTYNLIETRLISKMLGSQNNNADQLSSRFVTSI